MFLSCRKAFCICTSLLINDTLPPCVYCDEVAAFDGSCGTMVRSLHCPAVCTGCLPLFSVVVLIT